MATKITCEVNGQTVTFTGGNAASILPNIAALAHENPGKDITVTLRHDPEPGE